MRVHAHSHRPFSIRLWNEACESYAIFKSCRIDFSWRHHETTHLRHPSVYTPASHRIASGAEESLPDIRICPNHGAVDILFAVSNPLNVHDVWLWSVDQMYRCSVPPLINGYHGVVPKILEVMSAKWKWTQLTHASPRPRPAQCTRCGTNFIWIYTSIKFNWRINFNASPLRRIALNRLFGVFFGILFCTLFFCFFRFVVCLDY